jgi:endonuclease/exonuclease/phosphatase family metal-dependent hydrolase
VRLNHLRRRGFAGLFVFAMAWSCSRYPESSSPDPSAAVPSPDESRLRVITFNISGAPNLERLAKLVTGDAEMRHADVLLIQELPNGLSARALGELGSRIGLPFAHTAEQHVGAPSLGLLSRHPLSDLEILYLPQFDLGYRSRRRIAIAATLSFEESSVRVYNVHLDTRIRLSERIRQIKPVIDGALAWPRSIVAGDVNTIRSIPFMLPWIPLPLPGFDQAPGLDAHMKGLGFETPLEHLSFTGPLRMRLDAVFARGLRAGRHGVVAVPNFSDHVALWIDLAAGDTASR